MPEDVRPAQPALQTARPPQPVPQTAIPVQPVPQMARPPQPVPQMTIPAQPVPQMTRPPQPVPQVTRPALPTQAPLYDTQGSNRDAGFSAPQVQIKIFYVRKLYIVNYYQIKVLFKSSD